MSINNYRHNNIVVISMYNYVLITNVLLVSKVLLSLKTYTILQCYNINFFLVSTTISMKSLLCLSSYKELRMSKL